MPVRAVERSFTPILNGRQSPALKGLFISDLSSDLLITGTLRGVGSIGCSP